MVKFQRWMKCLATSRAAVPCTTEAMSCQGILGVVCLSMKSTREEEGDGGWLTKQVTGAATANPPSNGLSSWIQSLYTKLQ